MCLERHPRAVARPEVGGRGGGGNRIGPLRRDRAHRLHHDEDVLDPHVVQELRGTECRV
jgi:hypothetical protein